MSALETKYSKQFDDVIKRKYFLVTRPLWGESTGHRWIPFTKPVPRSFGVFFDLRLEQTFEQTIQAPVIWDTISCYDVTVMSLVYDGIA